MVYTNSSIMTLSPSIITYCWRRFQKPRCISGQPRGNRPSKISSSPYKRAVGWTPSVAMATGGAMVNCFRQLSHTNVTEACSIHVYACCIYSVSSIIYNFTESGPCLCFDIASYMLCQPTVFMVDRGSANT